MSLAVLHQIMAHRFDHLAQDELFVSRRLPLLKPLSVGEVKPLLPRLAELAVKWPLPLIEAVYGIVPSPLNERFVHTVVSLVAKNPPLYMPVSNFVRDLEKICAVVERTTHTCTDLRLNKTVAKLLRSGEMPASCLERVNIAFPLAIGCVVEDHISLCAKHAAKRHTSPVALSVPLMFFATHQKWLSEEQCKRVVALFTLTRLAEEFHPQLNEIFARVQKNKLLSVVEPSSSVSLKRKM